MLAVACTSPRIDDQKAAIHRSGHCSDFSIGILPLAVHPGKREAAAPALLFLRTALWNCSPAPCVAATGPVACPIFCTSEDSCSLLYIDDWARGIATAVAAVRVVVVDMFQKSD
jgi:hypothetical protein